MTYFIRLLALAGALIAVFETPSFAADIKVLPVGENDFYTIFVDGPIEEGDGDRFYEIAKTVPNAHVILSSPGGLVSEGLWIGAEIAVRNYYTWVLPGDGCHSICAVMWAAGAKRYMDKNANISVHAAYAAVGQNDGTVDYSVSGSANAEIGAFLNEVGLSLDAIRYFTVARPEEPLKPITPEIALWLDLDVHIVDGQKIERPEDRPTPRKITRQTALFAGMANQCSDVLSIPSQSLEMQAGQRLAEGHEMYGPEVFVDLLGEYVQSTKAEMGELGIVRWCLATEKELRSQSLQTYVDGPSFDCSKASTATEFAICGSEELWSLDRAMSWLFFYYRRNTSSEVSQEFLSDQREWLRRRNECSDNSRCLAEKYDNRLAELGV